MDDSEASDLEAVRAGIIAILRDKVPNLISHMSDQATIDMLRPPMRGNSRKEVDAGFDAAIWSLVADGIITPGSKSTVPGNVPDYGSTRASFPYFRITPLGILIAKSVGTIEPRDRSQYLKAARDRLPGADEVIFTYLAEASKNYSDRSYLSATVMLGISAEALMGWLIKALLSHVNEPRRSSYTETFEKYRYRTNKLYSEFLKLLTVHLLEVPDDLRFQVEAYLQQIETIIRVNRDDVAHGRATRVDPQLVHGNLTVYLSVLRIVNDLANALRETSPCTI